MKPRTCWVVVAGTGNAFYSSLEDYRKNAMADYFRRWKTTPDRWPALRRRGFRCIKVTVTEAQ